MTKIVTQLIVLDTVCQLGKRYAHKVFHFINATILLGVALIIITIIY